MTTTVLAFIPSPSQGVWHLGFVPLRAYALCIIAGIIAALILGDRRWEARGGERGVIYDIALWAVPFGLIGGRLYHVMTDWEKYFGPDGAGFLAALRIWDGGLGIWGAVALGGVGAWIACRRRGIPLPAFGDAVAPGIILAQAIGRLGNYFNQELYGRETDLPWGLTIYQRLDPSGVISPHSLDGVSTGMIFKVVHPTFLYELLWNLLIFAVLLWADRRFTLGHGRLFALYVAGYCVGRFWVELMRSDTATLIAGIRVNSFTSTFVFIGAVIYIMAAPKGREDPVSLRGKAADESRIDDLGEELAAVAATSGVVAAAKAAGDEETASAEPTAGGGTESAAAAEAEDLAVQVETAPSEDIVVAEEFAAAGVAADEEREAGLGSVEGDEAREAEVGAPEVHEAAVDGAARAESLAEDVAAEEPVVEESAAAPEDGLGSVEGDEVQAAQADAADVHDAAVEGTASAEATAEDVATDEPSADESTATPEDGLGSVEGDEVQAAHADAADVHDAAVNGTASAEATADDIATDDDPAVEEPAADDSTATPEDGLGSVEGDEVQAAQADAADVDDATVEGTASAEAAAEDVATDDDPAVTDPAADESAAPEDGLGSVEGDEVQAAQTDAADAADVDDAAVEGTASAEAAAEDVATDDDPAVADPAADESAAPEDGLGSVEGDEVQAAQTDAADVDDAAVEGTASAEAAAEEEDAVGENKSSVTPSTDAGAPRRRWWRRK